MDASFDDDFEECFEVNTSVEEEEEDYFETQGMVVKRKIGNPEPPNGPQRPKRGTNTATSGPKPQSSKDDAARILRALTGTAKPPPPPPPTTKAAPKKTAPKTRTLEALQCHNNAKMCLARSRNLKTDLKQDITAAVERLFQLVKEAEAESARAGGSGTGEAIAFQIPDQRAPPDTPKDLTLQLEENSKLLRENIAKMEDLKGSMERQREAWERAPTYSEAVAGKGKTVPKKGALHSVVVTSKDATETGEEVLEKLRRTMDAKEGWVKVERVRKAKDQKVIMSFANTEERDKARRKIEQNGTHLSVEEVKNRDPLLILRDVLKIHSDEDIMRALRNQNRDVFRDLDAGEDRVEIKYKRRTKNPLTCHIVLSVAPILWSRATQKGRLRIDLQQVRVEDQSPLVQCTRCLGYGHGRRFCKEPADLCSHCGGPHLRAECTARLAGEGPACRNCVTAKHSKTDHNAFSHDCPVKKKWDMLARATVAYC